MGKWDKYPEFDAVDFLTSEAACEAYLAAHNEDGAGEEELEDAYRDVERARIVHHIPASEGVVVGFNILTA